MTLGIKIGSIFIILVGTLLFSYLPYAISFFARRVKLVQRVTSPEKIIHLLDVFQGLAAGILLSSGLLHLLVEAQISEALVHPAVASLHHGDDDHHQHAFPWAFLCCSLAIVFIYVLEKVLEGILTKDEHKHEKKEKKEIQLEEMKTVAVNESKKEGQHVEHSVNPITEVLAETPKKEDPMKMQELEEHAHLHGLEYLNSNSIRNQIIGFVALWISLSVHSIIEGMGLGVSSKESQVWSLLIAIASHHFLAALALGTLLYNAIKSVLKASVFLILFSLTIPIGIVIGILATNLESSAFTVVKGVFLALSAGAFVHVSLLEIMAKTRIFPKWHLWTKMGLFIFGFAAMSVVNAFV